MQARRDELLFWAIAITVACLLLIRLALYAKRKGQETESRQETSDLEVLQVFSWTLAVFAALISLYLLLEAAQKIYNPEFYAMQLIIKSLR